MPRPAEIWLLGGTGDVGLRVAGFLARDPGGSVGAQIVLAARRAGQSAQIARRIGPGVHAEAFDVQDPDAAARIPSGAVVVNLTEATPPPLARSVVERGGDFIESSASPAYLTALESALSSADTSVELSGRAILYAGVFPGLSNLAAKALVRAAPQTTAMDLTVEMGLGRHYGEAATQWFLKAMNLPYPAMIKGRIHQMNAGEVSRKVLFHGDGTPRLALVYGFAEQTQIAQRLSLETVRSLIALDPPWATRALQGAIRLGLGAVIARHAPRVTRWMARGPGLGATRTRLVAEGNDATGAMSARVDVETGDQGDATAAILAGVVRTMFTRATRHPGIGDITDVLTFDAAIADLTRVMPQTRVWTSWQQDAGFRPSPAI